MSYFSSKLSRIERAYDTLAANNYLGYSGNFCFNEVRGKKVAENVERIRCFLVDIDSGITEQVLEELIELLKPSYVIVSSRTKEPRTTDLLQETYKYKAHFYWLANIDDQENLYNDWPALQTALAFKVEDLLLDMGLRVLNPITGFTDKGITNPAGTMRVPGLMHLKDLENTYLSRTVYTDESVVVTDESFNSFFNAKGIESKYISACEKRLEEIKQLKRAQGKQGAKEQKKERDKEGKESRGTSDKQISRYNGAAEGDRHRSMVDYCRNLFFNRGFSLNEAAGAVKEENLRSNKPPMEEVELEGIIEWCFTQYLEGLTDDKRERVKRGDSFAVIDLIKSAGWSRKVIEIKEPENYEPFKYDYSNIADFASLTSDVSLASRLMQRMGESLGLNPEICSYVESKGKWDENEGYVYEKMKDVIFDTVTDAAVTGQFVNNKGQVQEKELNNFKERMFSAHKQNAIASIIKRTPSLIIDQNKFNANPNLLHVSNGTLDIETGKLGKWNSRDFITMTSGVEWDDGAGNLEMYKGFENEYDYTDPDNLNSEGNLWTRYLYEVMGGSLEMCRYLHKIAGYSLLGQNPEELIFFLYGDGQNGKSVFIETLLHLLGEYAFTVPVGLFIENAKLNKEALIAQLPGKRLISTSEVKSSHAWDEESIKSMSGMDEINARALFSKSFTYTPCFKTFVRGNNCPIINSNDFGVWRRIRLIPFNVQIPFEKRDTGLIKKLTTPDALKELLVWAVAGYQIYLAEGIVPPVEAQMATDEYRRDMNPVSTFVSECFDKIGDIVNGIGIDDIMNAYNAWKAINTGDMLTKQQMSKQLHKDKVKSKVIWRDGKSVKLYPLVVKAAWRGVKGEKSNVVELFKNRATEEKEAEEG